MANLTSSPHDKLFKTTMSRPLVAKKFLQKYLPEQIKKIIDLNTLKLQSGQFVDAKLNGCEADMLYSVQFGEEKGYVYILFEHLSNPDKMVPFRLLKYMINIIKRHMVQNKTEMLPMICPIIVYTGDKKYPYSTDIFDLFGKNFKSLASETFLKPFQLLDIKNINDEELRRELLFGLMVSVMKTKAKNPLELAKILLSYLSEINMEDNFEFIIAVIEYTLKTKEVDDKELFFHELVKNLSKDTGTKIMTIADQLIHEGMQQGIQQGEVIAFERCAVKLLLDGETIERVAKLTGLSREKIELLKQNITH